jgi:hypothetical protein
MSYEERREADKGFMRVRSTLHIGMGVLYLVFGSAVIYMQRFGNLALPGFMAYIVGGLMLLYGGFRIWRGLRDARERKLDNIRRDLDNIDHTAQ